MWSSLQLQGSVQRLTVFFGNCGKVEQRGTIRSGKTAEGGVSER